MGESEKTCGYEVPDLETAEEQESPKQLIRTRTLQPEHIRRIGKTVQNKKTAPKKIIRACEEASIFLKKAQGRQRLIHATRPIIDLTIVRRTKTQERNT